LGESTPPTQRPTTPDVTSVSELISSSSPQAALDTLIQDSKDPEKPREDYRRQNSECVPIFVLSITNLDGRHHVIKA